jgi:hypothetical protein
LDSSNEDSKADAIAQLGEMVFLLLETSGLNKTKDRVRFSQDQIKCSFGALTFFRKILKTWNFATDETMTKLKVVFVHARGKSST